MNYLYVYILIINIISFCLIGIDKYFAKNNMYRISEKTLVIVSLLLGGIGSFIGMYFFRHKTKHKKFIIGIPIIILLNIFTFYFIVEKIGT